MDESVSPLSNVVPQGLLEFFVGRDAQLKDIERRVSAGHRVLAISGQPGTGKTSLARMFAERLKGHFSVAYSLLTPIWQPMSMRSLSVPVVGRFETIR